MRAGLLLRTGLTNSFLATEPQLGHPESFSLRALLHRDTGLDVSQRVYISYQGFSQAISFFFKHGLDKVLHFQQPDSAADPLGGEIKALSFFSHSHLKTGQSKDGRLYVSWLVELMDHSLACLNKMKAMPK